MRISGNLNVRKETRAYQGRLQEEINQDRENSGKKPFPPDEFFKEETKEFKESSTDPESGHYVKDEERTNQFAYSFHAAADRNGFVLGSIVTPGKKHDNILEHQVEQVIEKVEKTRCRRCSLQHTSRYSL